jgi:hypothetical protein
MIKKYVGAHVKKPPFSLSDFKKLEFSRQFFEKYSNIKFHENPSSGSRAVACGQRGGRTDMTKQIVAFRNFANAPKNRAHVTYPGTSLPCPREPRAGPCSEPDESSPHHYTSSP